jgi:hypothetical protein
MAPSQLMAADQAAAELRPASWELVYQLEWNTQLSRPNLTLHKKPPIVSFLLFVRVGFLHKKAELLIH